MRDTPPLKEDIKKTLAIDPKARLERFTLFKYQGENLESKTSAQLGEFLGPNLVVLRGDIQNLSVANGTSRKLFADRVKAVLSGGHIDDLVNKATLEDVYFYNELKLVFSDYTLTTQAARYHAKTKAIDGPNPVHISGLKRWFSGDSGFLLSLEKDSLDIFGKIKGEFTFNEKTSN